MNYLSKENVANIIGLSRLQKDMIVREEQSGDGTAFIAQAVRDLPGPVQPELLQTAWNHVIGLHPVLRSIFRIVKNRDVQIVLKQRPIELSCHDLSQMAQAEQEAEIAAQLKREREPFPLAEGPLFRAALLLRSDKRSTLIVTHHRAILDGPSLNIVLSDLLQTYAALERGAELPSADRRPFGEYLNWLGQQDFTAAKHFFAETFSSFEAPTALFGESRALTSIPRFRTRTFTLPDTLSFADETLVTAAWAILLNVYSGEEKAVFGLTLSGRPVSLDGAERMAGPFANTLPLMLHPVATLPVRDFLHEVAARVERLNEYAHLPLSQINMFCGLQPEQPFYHSALAFDLPRIALSFDSARVEESSVDRMLEHLLTVLESLRQQQGTLADLNLLSAADLDLYERYNQTRLPAPALDKLAHQVIEEQAVLRPDSIAAVCGADRLTYRELNERANRLAHWLRQTGFGRDDIAALLASRSLDMLTAILAVLKAGGAYVPLDAAHPDTRLRAVAESSHPKVIFTERALLDRSRTLTQAAVFCLEEMDAATAEYPSADPAHQTQGHDLANVFFTSGSTGLPKGAMVEHIGMLNHLYAKINLLGLDEHSIVAQNASHCFDVSVWQFLAPLMTGGRVVIYPNVIAMDASALLHAVKQDKITHLEMVPALIEMFLSAAHELPEEERSLSSLSQMISTGEGLPVSLCQKWLETYPDMQVVNTYGATECSDDTSHEVVSGTCRDTDLTHVALGTPIPNFRLYLLDKAQRQVPVGCVGEVYLTGIGVGRGYLGDPERTAEAFFNNPFADNMGDRMYKTGDLARLLPDGRLAFINRADFQVKVRGHRIELGEVEAGLLKHPQVAQTAAVVRPDAAGQNRILGYVVLKGTGDSSDLKSFLPTVLPEYMIPEVLIPLDKMPLNQNGKIDRKSLPEPDESARAAVYAAPRTDTELKLAAIWSEVLGVEQVGLDDNFFDLGGHSLKTMQVRTRIKREFDVDLTLKELFAGQSLHNLAGQIENLLQNGTASSKIPRLQPAEHYPLSHGQKRLYLIEQMDETNNSYHLPAALELTGHLDVAALKLAFQMIVDRHNTLRTLFPLAGGEPVQRILTSYELPCPYDDLSAVDESALLQVIAEESRQAFNLATEPAFRIRLIKRGEHRHLLLLNLHHIISDGWSGQVLLDEFAVLYDACRQNRPNPLPPLALQYTDYAAWMNARLADGALQEAERYWLTTFQGELPVLDLPTDRPRPPLPTFRGAQVSLRVEQELSDALVRFCRDRDVTLFMGLLIVTTVFLSKLTGRQDLIIGTPVAGRHNVEIEELIGFFVNTLALRLDLRNAKTIADLSDHVKQTALDAYEHQEYPFDRLVEKLNPVRDPSRSPLFSVMFQTGGGTQEKSLDGLTVRPYQTGEVSALFDLCITCVQRESRLEILFDYNCDLFEAATMQRWLTHYHTLLQNIFERPDRPLSSLQLLTDAEKLQLLPQRIPGSEAVPIFRTFADRAAQTPDAVALMHALGDLTYRDLLQRAAQTANRLRALGAGPGIPVGLSMHNSPEAVIGLLGILQAGGTYVPLDANLPSERLSFILRDAGVNILVTMQPLLKLMPEHGLHLLCLDEESANSDYTASEVIEPAADDPAYMIYTSGSTGQPKGVTVPHSAVHHYLQALAPHYELKTDDRVLQFASIAFDVALEEILLTLTQGAVLVIPPPEARQSLTAFTAYVRQAELTVLNLPAAFTGEWLTHLAKTGESLPDSLRLVITGSDRLQPRCFELWRQIAPDTCRFLYAYGTTETTITSTLCELSASDSLTGKLPIGRPLLNTEVYILDESLQPVPIGVTGQLCIGGDSLALGYHHRPELTAASFIAHPFRAGERLYQTGDLARWLPDGQIEFLGRLDQQVKVRGLRIEPGEIETALLQHPAVRETVVFSKGDALLAWIVPEHADVTRAELRSHLQEKLPEYMVPSSLILLDKLPFTANGKIDRQALPAPEAREEADTYQPPRDQLEVQLTMLWEAVLGVKPLGITDNFFVHGGHSMKAMALMGEIAHRYGVDLPLALLFRKPTISELAAHLREKTHASADCLVPIQTGDGTRPPFFLIHPQGGGVMGYFHLARELGANESVYGLQAVGYETDEEPLTTIEEMAERYLRELEQAASQGPLRIAGWSFGGLVAYEMVRRLEEQGREVQFLGLFDSNTFATGERSASSEEETLIDYARQLGFDVSGHTFDESVDRLLRHAKEIGFFPQAATRDTLRRKLLIMMQNGHAGDQYRPKSRIRADIHLYLAEQSQVEPETWLPHTLGHVHINTVPGDHDKMFKAPHVKKLAEAILQAPVLQPIK